MIKSTKIILHPTGASYRPAHALLKIYQLATKKILS